MYVILTSKPGQFRTEPVDGVVPVESYDYLFYGRRTTHFVIAELQRETKIRVVEERRPRSSTTCRPSFSSASTRSRPRATRCAAGQLRQHGPATGAGLSPAAAPIRYGLNDDPDHLPEQRQQGRHRSANSNLLRVSLREKAAFPSSAAAACAAPASAGSNRASSTPTRSSRRNTSTSAPKNWPPAIAWPARPSSTATSACRGRSSRRCRADAAAPSAPSETGSIA